MRWLVSVALLTSLLTLTACGMGEDERAQPAGSLEPAPPIESIDEPAPDWPPADREEQGVASIVVLDQETETRLMCPGVEPDECKPTSEELAAFRQKVQEQHVSMRPADGTKPRAIARLMSAEEGTRSTATFIAWRSANDKLCMQVELGDAGKSQPGAFGPYGPCVPWWPCGQICLERISNTAGPGEDVVSVLGGTVPAEGNELRVVFLGGTSSRYPLRGPLVPGFDDARVFLLDLGERLVQRLELLEDGKLRASLDVPRQEIESQLCLRRFPAMKTVPQEANPELVACLRNARKDEGNG